MYDTKTHATEHFSWAELDPQNLAGPVARANLHKLANDVLEPIRKHFGKPVHVTSGYRDISLQRALYQRDVAAHGGVPSGEVAAPGHSQHEVGTAADIWIEGVAPSTVAAYAATLPTVGGIGIYASFTHVDIRARDGGVIARW